MADSVGIKIGVEGEREFKAVLRDINAAYRVLGSEMTLAASQFDKQDKSVAALTARNGVLTKEIDAQKGKIETLKSALDNASASFGETDKRTLAWQAQLNKAQAELNNMERELADNNAAIKSNADRYDDLGREIEETAREYVKVREQYGKNSAEAKELEARLQGLSAEHREAGKAADAEDKEIAEVTKSLGLYERATDESADKTGKFGAVLKGIGVALGAVAVAAGAAAVKLSKEVIKSFGEFEQNLGGSEAVFGQYAASIQKAGEESYKNLGVSQSQYLATANKMGALFQGSGIEQQKSLELTEKAMQRAADVASVMGIDMQVALDSVAGAAKGNFTMMDNLGVAMNATSIQAYAVSKGLDFVWASASQAEKAEVAMQMFFETTEQYAGNFARESTETISGSMGMLQAAVGSFTAGLGNANADMMNLTGNVVDAFGSVVKNIVPVLNNVVAALPGVMEAIIAGLAALLPSILNAGAEIIQSLMRGIIQALPALTQGAMQLIMGVVKGLIDNLPALAGAAVQMVATLARELAGAMPQLVPAAIEAVMTVVKTILGLLPELVAAGFALMGGLVEGLGNAIPLLKPVTTAISGLFDILQMLAPFIAAAAAAVGVFAIAMNASTIATTAQAIATKVVTAAQWLWNAAMAANPIGLIIAGVVALIAAIAVLVSWFNRESEEQKALKASTEALVEENNALIESIEGTGQAYADRQKEMAAEAGAAKSLADQIKSLSEKENKSAEDKKKLTALINTLNDTMGETVVTYDEETDALSRNMSEIYSRIDAMREEAKAQAARERAVEIAKEQMMVEEQLNDVSRQRQELDQALADGVYKKGENDKKYKEVLEELNATEAALLSQQGELAESFDFVSQAAVDAAAAQEEANAAVAESTAAVTDALTEAHAIQEELNNQKIAKEEEVTNAMIQAASEQGITLEEYKANLKKTEDSLKQYTNATTEMFKKIDTKSKDTAKSMADNLTHNTKVTEEWSSNIINLSERGIRGGLLDKLQAAGPESAAMVQNLVNASDAELKELQTAFENGTDAAIKVMMEQMGMPDVTNSGSDMVDNIAQGVGQNEKLKTATEHLIKTAKATASGTVASSGFGDIGSQIVNGVWQGIQSREAWFRSQVSSFFKRIVSSVKSDLGIQSPSKVFAGIGENMAQGLGVGFGDAMNRVAADMQNAIPSRLEAGYHVTGEAARRGRLSGGDINVTQNIYTPQYDYAAQQLAAAREFRQIARQLA